MRFSVYKVPNGINERIKNIKVSFAVNSLALNVIMRLKINHIKSIAWMIPAILVAIGNPK
jgi:hypothetical protein